MMVDFLYRVLCYAESYEAAIITLATSITDEASVRLLSPASWIKGTKIVERKWQGLPILHVGALLTEFEFQRYRPRRTLTRLLSNYDLIQMITGSPPVTLSSINVDRPTCAFVASTTLQERASALARNRGFRRVWLRLMSSINGRIEAYALSRLTHVFAESNYTYSLLADLVPASRLTLGVPGIDTSLFHPELRSRTDSYILSVARFADPRKNVRLLFAAYRQLRASVPNPPRLVLAGVSPPTEEDWSLAVKWDIANQIDVYVNVTKEKLAQLYRHAALFVLSSNEEGLGLVILEAMASGLPVVSTRCGGPETAIIDGETGCLTPVGDAKAMAEKLRVLLSDPALRRQMGKRARQVVEERFSLEAAGNVYLRKYDEILGLS